MVIGNGRQEKEKKREIYSANNGGEAVRTCRSNWVGGISFAFGLVELAASVLGNEGRIPRRAKTHDGKEARRNDLPFRSKDKDPDPHQDGTLDT